MRLLARAAATSAAIALAFASATTAIAQELPSDADTPTDSPSAWDGVWPWLLLGVGVFVVLALVAVGVGWRGRRSAEATPVQAPSPTAPSPPRRHPSTSDVAVLTFARIEGAERAFADARDDLGEQPWLLEVAFVECHRHGRVVVRGTFAGRYVDIDGAGDGLSGLAERHGGLLDEIRANVPEGSSAIVTFAPTEDVDAIAEAFRDSGARLARHRVSGATAAALEPSVAGAPAAVAPLDAAPAITRERSRP